MEYLVRVSDTKLLSRDFSVFLDLPDLLPVLEPEARSWTWSMQRIPETSLVIDSDIDSIAELEAWIREGPQGFVMDYDELYWFGRQVAQVVWGEFVAAETPAVLPHPDDSDEWVGEHALAGLFAFDSSYWLVGGPASVIERVINRFEHVEHLDPRQWVRDAR